MACPLCSSNNIRLLYSEQNIPVFQNKVYQTVGEAKNVTCGDIALSFCEHCGFIWNAAFNPNLLEYDENYQNEQGLSQTFQQHLNQVCNIISKEIPNGAHVVEIGCGKAKFLFMMEKLGYYINGYDPAYEGDDTRIIKEYYPLQRDAERKNRENADVLILRHVLEHIQNPISFLRNIASANDYSGLLYIEVPDFNWIIEHNAFHDVFYEHCNYFTLSGLQALFPDFVSSGLLFEGQYCYIIIKLESFHYNTQNISNITKTPEIKFSEYINEWSRIMRNKRDFLIWGAGAKGATFLRLIDPDRKFISGVIDINPKKQGCFISKTAHKIYSPDNLNQLSPSGIIIMNGNYLREIIDILKDKFNIPIYVLGESFFPVNK